MQSQMNEDISLIIFEKCIFIFPKKKKKTFFLFHFSKNLSLVFSLAEIEEGGSNVVRQLNDFSLRRFHHFDSFTSERRSPTPWAHVKVSISGVSLLSGEGTKGVTWIKSCTT